MMKFFYPLFFLTLHFTYAQTDTLYLWPDKVPGSSSVKAPPVSREIGDGSSRVFEVTDPILSVFEPAEKSRNGKAVLVCPGGGYIRLAAHKEGYVVAEWLATLGYTAFVLQYRVPDQKPGALQDTQRAMKLIRSKANDYRLDINQIGAIGFSAGAHLVALIGMAKEEQNYDRQDAVDDFSSRPDKMMIIYPGYLDMGPDRSLTPDLIVTDKIVPTFIFQSMDDRIVRSSFVLAEALQKAGNSVALHLVPEGGHGYGMYPGNPAAEAWPKLLAEWLKTYF